MRKECQLNFLGSELRFYMQYFSLYAVFFTLLPFDFSCMNVQVWHALLAIRELVLPPTEYIDTTSSSLLPFAGKMHELVRLDLL